MTKKNKEKETPEKNPLKEEDINEYSLQNEDKSEAKEGIRKEKNIEELEKEVLIAKDEKLRLLADMENLRKRFDKEKTESIKYGSSNLARDILAPFDNLDRALNALNIEKNKNNEGLIDGLKMIYQEMTTILKKHGIEKINALNEKFDHNYHQAMMEIDSDEHEPGTVIKELQAGYTMHERLLRPSMVGVSKKKEDK